MSFNRLAAQAEMAVRLNRLSIDRSDEDFVEMTVKLGLKSLRKKAADIQRIIDSLEKHGPSVK